jgi:hypothetical protein
MIVYKNHIDDYIKCPFLFGKKILKNKQNTIKVTDLNLALKKFLIEIAAYEMQNDCKLGLVEYRTKFTNKYYGKKANIDLIESVVPKLNRIFSTFANCTFIGYNVPVDIGLPGTSVIFRDIVDFLLVSNDDEEKMFAVEIEDLSDFDFSKKKLENWPHQYISYSFLSSKFGKDINVELVDPDEFTIIEAAYNSDAFIGHLEQLSNIASCISSDFLYKNLNYCEFCELKDECK